jgi:hypothetical protein
MKKIFAYVLVNIFTWNPDKSLEIVREFLGSDNLSKVNARKTPSLVTPPLRSKSKREEIIDSLNYLRSKTNKTKQDKESIYSLEMVLKNLA